MKAPSLRCNDRNHVAKHIDLGGGNIFLSLILREGNNFIQEAGTYFIVS